MVERLHPELKATPAAGRRFLMLLKKTFGEKPLPVRKRSRM
jgi:hypothetical protein